MLRKSRARSRFKFCIPKKPKQAYAIANNGRKVRHGVSKEETDWLNKLGIVERSKVIILFGKTMVIDGFNSKTNTCYEYMGSWTHGAHQRYPNNRDVISPFLKKSPNQLYFGTIERYNLLVGAGFKVFFVWDYQYKKGNLGRYYRGPGDNMY